ncbi:MAG: sulfatase-like hydrolase/transferase [Eubacteriales bacterium]
MPNNKKPNVLMIISDDHGFWAMGCAGNREVKTPNLDRIAAMGIRFTDFYCASPVCSPARASIFTGEIPSRHGIHDWLSRGYVDSDILSDELKKAFDDPNAPWEYSWPRSQLKDDRAIRFLDGHDTFTAHLADAGYECALSGKWHLGGSATPQAGFTYWKTIAMGGENYYYPVMLEDGIMQLKHGEYVTDLITDNALSYLDIRDQNRPFCLTVAYTAPHAPWAESHHPKKYIDMYRDCPFDSVPHETAHKYGDMRGMSGEKYENTSREYLTGYYAAITAMDDNIGRILDRLESDGTLDDTLIIFTGDNGMCMGHHGIFGKGNGTFPVNMYDESVKVPVLWAHKNGFEGGRVSGAVLSHLDIFPTLLDYLGIPFEKPAEMPGESFKKVLCGGAPAIRDVVAYDEYGPARMIRRGKYKYVHRYDAFEQKFPCELYDMEADPGERENLIDSADPDIIAVREGLRQRLFEWFDRYSSAQNDGAYQRVCGIGQLGRVGNGTIENVFRQK